MNIKEKIKHLSAFGSALIIAGASTVSVAFAEDTTTSAEETVQETVTTAATEKNISEKTDSTGTSSAADWYKANISDYDDSISLTSYTASPSINKDGVPDEERLDGKIRRTPGVPTPVELKVTGGYVDSIPFVEQVPYIDAQPGQFAIVTYGWGHGVGMSQNGANFYATYSGWTYQDILFHYYPGTYLMNTGTAEDEELTMAGVTDDTLSIISEIVFAEVGGSMDYEAIKAQAVAAYTYCKYNGDDAADLRGKANPPQIVIDACTEVLGEALYYNDDFALTMFSASSGGITANCYEVFWADLPYLRSVSSDYDKYIDPHYGTVTYFSDIYIKKEIESQYGIILSDNPVNWIQPIYSEETGYVTDVVIDGQITVRGYDFKLDMGLKAPKFSVYYTYRYPGDDTLANANIQSEEQYAENYEDDYYDENEDIENTDDTGEGDTEAENQENEFSGDTEAEQNGQNLYYDPYSYYGW